MQRMELMLKMTDKENVKNYVLPLIHRALETNNDEIQVIIHIPFNPETRYFYKEFSFYIFEPRFKFFSLEAYFKKIYAASLMFIYT